MSTYTQIIYQIVFGTKNNENTLTKENRSKLFEYILGILPNNKCQVLHQRRGGSRSYHLSIASKCWISLVG